jgi:hypothetical protein
VVTIERGVVGFRFDNGDDDNMAEIVEWLDWLIDWFGFLSTSFYVFIFVFVWGNVATGTVLTSWTVATVGVNCMVVTTHDQGFRLGLLKRVTMRQNCSSSIPNRLFTIFSKILVQF